MNQELNDKWNEAVRTNKPVEIGNLVVCDVCDKNYTGQPDQGGFVFGSKAICPICAPMWEAKARRYDEVRAIKARANPGESFADFVIRYRGKHSTVSVTTSPSVDRSKIKL